MSKHDRMILQRIAGRAAITGIWLGGAAGEDGGTGTAPGGFVGQLAQQYVTYDTTEGESSSGSASLVSNLNHIRKRIADIEDVTGPTLGYNENGDFPVACITSGSDSISIGNAHNVSGAQSGVLSGYGNTVSGGQSVIAGGYGNTVSGYYAAVLGGKDNLSSGSFSRSYGEYAVANKHGQAASAAGRFSASGDAQVSTLIARCQTSGSIQSEMFLNGTSERCIIGTDTTWMFDVQFAARRTDVDGESAGYGIRGVLDNNAGTTALVGSLDKYFTVEDQEDWDATIEADDTNDALALKVTGENAKTIRWVARINLVEVKG